MQLELFLSHTVNDWLQITTEVKLQELDVSPDDSVSQLS